MIDVRMASSVWAVDPHAPGARIATVVELIVDLGAGGECQLGRGAGDAYSLRGGEGQGVAALEIAAEEFHRLVMVSAVYEVGETLLSEGAELAEAGR